MNVSGSRAAEDINLDEFERRLRAAGAQQPSAEDPLLELARLIKSSRFGASDSGPPARAAVESAGAASEIRAIDRNGGPEAGDRRSGGLRFPRRQRRIARRGKTMSSPTHPSHDANPAEQAAEARPKGWMLKVSALALAGVAMIGAVFALKGGAPGLSREPPFIAAAQGPTKVQPPSDETVTASNDAGGSLLKDNAKPGSVKVISSEEQPVDLSAEASIGNASAARANPPAAADLAKSPAGGSERDAGRRHRRYAARAAACCGAPAADDLGIPQSQTGSNGFAAAGRDADCSVKPSGPERSRLRPPPAAAPARRRPASLRRRRRAMRLGSRSRRRPNSICPPSFLRSRPPAS